MKSKLQTIYLKDYRPPSYLVETVDLHVELSPLQTKVRATLQFKANPDCTKERAELYLHGRQLELLSIKLDGQELAASRAFSVCHVEKVFAHVCLRGPASQADRDEIERIADVFESANHSLRRVFAETSAYCMGD